MATADQIKSLIRSHFSNDEERFHSIALQVAAHEAQQGHGSLAHEIRDIVDKANRDARQVLKFPQDLWGLVLSEEPSTSKSTLVVPETIMERLGRIIHEYRQQSRLKQHGLTHRRKILLIGPPGTGKTMTSRILAHELHIPLHTVQIDKMVTKFMGETAAKLRLIFDLIQHEQGVYFFDEFDAIGGERGMENDVGEMRRVLSAFLQFIEQDTSDSLIIAATNSPELLDKALFRRFDDVLFYQFPSEIERRRLIVNVLNAYMPPKLPWKSVIRASENLSHAEIDYACRDAVKQSILTGSGRINANTLLQVLKERVAIQQNQTR